ncbi:hypothetical protein [Nocardia beijingensis]
MRSADEASGRRLEDGLESPAIDDIQQRHGSDTNDDLATERPPQLLCHLRAELIRRHAQLRRQRRCPALIADVTLGVSTLSVIGDEPLRLGSQVPCLRIAGLLGIENPVEEIHRFVARPAKLRHSTVGSRLTVRVGCGFGLLDGVRCCGLVAVRTRVTGWFLGFVHSRELAGDGILVIDYAPLESVRTDHAGQRPVTLAGRTPRCERIDVLEGHHRARRGTAASWSPLPGRARAGRRGDAWAGAGIRRRYQYAVLVEQGDPGFADDRAVSGCVHFAVDRRQPGQAGPDLDDRAAAVFGQYQHRIAVADQLQPHDRCRPAGHLVDEVESIRQRGEPMQVGFTDCLRDVSPGKGVLLLPNPRGNGDDSASVAVVDHLERQTCLVRLDSSVGPLPKRCPA